MGWIFKNTCVQCMDAHTCTCTHTTCNHISLYTLLIINLFIIFYLFIFSAGGPSVSKARGNITLMMLVSVTRRHWTISCNLHRRRPGSMGTLVHQMTRVIMKRV